MADTPESILVLDGATGTELGRRGVNIDLPLWSAGALINAPDDVHAVHRAYLQAGARAITTCTFRTHARSLARVGREQDADALTRLAVDLARQARDEIDPEAIILGSVAPLEECYRPDLAPGRDIARHEHGRLIETLLSAGVDCILIETMNCLREALAAADAARQFGPEQWMISFCTRNEGPPGILLSGEPLVDALPSLESALAVGVNCISPTSCTAQIDLLRHLLPDHIHVLAYANIGYADVHGNWITTDAVDPQRYAGYVQQWIDAGATLVGGCCGTTPETIRAINSMVGSRARAWRQLASDS